MQPAIPVRQHRDRRVVAHGADRLLRILHHRVQDHFQLFQRKSHRKLAAAQFLALIQHGLRRIGLDDVVDLGDPPCPGPERLARRQHVLQFLVTIERACSRSTAIVWPGPTRPFSMILSPSSFTIPVSEPTISMASEVIV